MNINIKLNTENWPDMWYDIGLTRGHFILK